MCRLNGNFHLNVFGGSSYSLSFPWFAVLLLSLISTSRSLLFNETFKLFKHQKVNKEKLLYNIPDVNVSFILPLPLDQKTRIQYHAEINFNVRQLALRCAVRVKKLAVLIFPSFFSVFFCHCKILQSIILIFCKNFEFLSQKFLTDIFFGHEQFL